MLVEEIAALFNDLVDEDDPTFMTAANAQLYLRVGYDRFRALVTQADPNILTRRQQITYLGTNQYDLSTGAVRLFGATATAPVLVRLLEVTDVTGNPQVPPRLVGVSGITELYASNDAYLLQGNILYVSAPTTHTFEILYLPRSQVDWTRVVVGNNEFVDDLNEWHDLIALLAYEYYAVRDGADSPQAQRLLDRRTEDLLDHLHNGRSSEANARIVDTGW